MYFTKYYIEHTDGKNNTILINTLTGNILNLGKIDNIKPKIKDLESLSDDFKTELIQNSFLYSDKSEEDVRIKDIRLRSELYSEECDPTIYVIYITYDCNIICNYCCYNYLKNKKEIIENTSIDSIFQSIKELQKRSGRKRSRICLFGGEPLMKKNFDDIKNVFSKLKTHINEEKQSGRECELMIFTNGVDVPFYKDLLLESRDIIKKILITLIGNKEENDLRRKHFDGKGTFDDVVRGIECLLSIGIKVWAVANIDKKNVEKIPYLISLVKEKGWDKHPFFAGYYIGRIKYYSNKENSSISEYELLNAAIEYLKDDKIGQEIFNFGDIRNLKPVLNLINHSISKNFQKFYACSSGNLQQYSFGSDNKIYTCSGAMGIDEYSLGEYKPNCVINKEKASFWTNRDVMSIEKCKDCNVAFLCGGGCYYAAKVINGSEYEPVCTPIEELVHAYMNAIEKGIKIKYEDLLRD